MKYVIVAAIEVKIKYILKKKWKVKIIGAICSGVCNAPWNFYLVRH